MGLLDDAIREHLELKRLRGADPGLVAREEHEAFGLAREGEPDDADRQIEAPEDRTGENASQAGQDPAQSEGFSNVGQETAELDMRAVLQDDSERTVAPVPASAVGPAGSGATSGDAPNAQGDSDESLEWEMPSEDTPSRPHGGDEGEPSGEANDEPVEDVLEETPDFLRDTPEQERLWFEQRPPRDFDFDK